MSTEQADISEETPIKQIAAHCMSYQGADEMRSVFQLITTVILYVAILIAAYYSMQISYWLTALLIILAAGLLTRLFTLQHDCGHGSFFKTKKMNDWTGRFLSLFTVTPYDFWRRSHNIHHATSGNLDHRNVGGVETITVKEYQSYTPLKKFLYRIYRNPVFLLMFGTPIYILLASRIPHTERSMFYDNGKSLSGYSRWKSSILTTLSLTLFYGVMAYFVGVNMLLLVILPTLILTSWIGGWLFFIQHQFEDTYWDGSENWKLQEASLHGSSYYKLPKILQWFTGNIGLHHIHHLCSKIPNYKLQECMDARPELRDINQITFWKSLKCMRLKLWDEDKKCLVNFKQIHTA